VRILFEALREPLSRLSALIAQGCTKKPESYPLSSLRVDYQTWTCQQLANEADLLKDALALRSAP
jgi:hypothetical protein